MEELVVFFTKIEKSNIIPVQCYWFSFCLFHHRVYFAHWSFAHLKLSPQTFSLFVLWQLTESSHFNKDSRSAPLDPGLHQPSEKLDNEP